MKRVRLTLLLLLSTSLLIAQDKADPAKKTELSPINIEAQPMGDTGETVLVRFTFLYQITSDVPFGTPLVIQGSYMQGGKVIRNFRHLLRPDARESFTMLQQLPPGQVEVEARLLIPFEETAPVILAKSSKPFTITKTGKEYVAAERDGAEGFLAEGVVPETSGSIRIRPPRRSLAPNLFIVDVEVKDPVKRVEFWVEGKKIFTKNAAPYRAELDLGNLPRRVEVKVIGYDSAGRYIDADAWIVNERESPLELKLTRTVTADGVSHLKISIQNQAALPIKSVELYAGDKKIYEWSQPPYALDLASTQLAGAEFLRATALNSTGLEASDLIFLDGSRYMEQIDINLVELPVSVTDNAGAPIVNLTKDEFEVFEDGKRQKISEFGFSENLPLSVGVLVDHSGSMKERIKTAREAAVSFFEEIIGPRDRAFFGGFSWEASKISSFSSEVGSLKSYVAEMPDPEGGTALYDAIVSGLYRFRTIPGRKALIIVTDGEDTASRILYDDMLRYVRASRVPIYFIAVGMNPLDFGANSKMKGLAAETGGVAYFIRNADQLKQTYEQLEKDLRTQYLISYYTESTKNDQKYRTVDVRTKRKDVKVRTIRGFIP